MSDYKFGFIGAGNMGGALAEAVAKSVPVKNITVSDADLVKAEAFAEKLGCHLGDNEKIAKESDYIFLGVKPQILPEVLKSITKTVSSRKNPPVIVSMAAGVSVNSISGIVGDQFPIIRIMPNTPAAVGEGMILYTCVNVNQSMIEGFLNAMSAAGQLDEIPEKLIDAASAVSGCGPAFVYMFIEALADGGVECGLTYDKALRYAAQTVLGAAKTVQETGNHPEALKNAVCSPGGTTIEGVHALEEGGFRVTAMNAVTAAYKKTLKLAGK